MRAKEGNGPPPHENGLATGMEAPVPRIMPTVTCGTKGPRFW